MPYKMVPLKTLRGDPEPVAYWWNRNGSRGSFHVGQEACARSQRVEIGDRALRDFISFAQYQRTLRGSSSWQTIDHVSLLKMVCRWTGGGMEDRRLRMLIRTDDDHPDPPVSDWPMFSEDQVTAALAWFSNPTDDVVVPDLPETKLSPVETMIEMLRSDCRQKDMMIAMLREQIDKLTDRLKKGESD